MQDKDLFQQLLGIARPWRVADSELKVKAGEVVVQMQHLSDAEFRCPECNAVSPIHDHAEERSWRHDAVSDGHSRGDPANKVRRAWSTPGKGELE